MQELVDLENNLLSCILLKPNLLKELYVSDNYFSKRNKPMLVFLKKHYAEHNNLDMVSMTNSFPTADKRGKFIEWCADLIDSPVNVAFFYHYQEQFEEQYRRNKILEVTNEFIKQKDDIKIEDFVEQLMQIQNEAIVSSNDNGKLTPTEMKNMLKRKDEVLKLTRLSKLDELIKLKKNTIVVIGARPSEGKSALALNLFCDYAKKYKCLYFNMEMTEIEVYERMVGIVGNYPLKHISCPPSIASDRELDEILREISRLDYKVVNGSKSISSIKSKIIREQRNRHLVVFIDYVGYVTSRAGLSDKDRIGEVVRELNGITKDYNCTIFLIAQINRNGSERPTLIDLKDSGEIEQTADTVILIHDKNKEDISLEKDIELLIPKCRGGVRNIKVNARYDKGRQRFTVL